MGGAVLGSAALLNRDDDSVSALNETQRQLSFVHDCAAEKGSNDPFILAPNRSRDTNCRQSWYSTLKGWSIWVLSVVVTSLVLSHIQSGGLEWVTGSLGHWMNSSDPKSQNVDAVMKSDTTGNSRLPKRASCGSGGIRSEDYNLNLHVGALFIILFVSGTACAFPVLATKFSRLRIPPGFLFAARHFGTGVLIATAFVHLLPTAFITLGDPCLSNFWTTDYPAMPGAIVLAAVFFVTLVEMVFSPAGHHVCAGPQPDLDAPNVPRVEPPEPEPTALVTQARKTHRPRLQSVDSSKSLRNFGPLVGRSSSISRTVARMGEENENLDRVEATQAAVEPKEAKMAEIRDEDPERNLSSRELSQQQKDKKAIVQCVMLEVGILFHSVFIGMALSVSIGNEFVILLIAITFHQTFEGLALGARIAALNWPDKSYQPWLMAFAYGCTTPFGQAIGLATHTLYSPDSEVGLLLVGVMNAISAGVLVFASLVELLSEDFLSDESWRILKGKRRVYACILVFLGAFGMSLVGAWA